MNPNKTESFVLSSLLENLKLPMFKKHYESFAKDATQQQYPYPQYLKNLAQEELIYREQRRIKNLITRAKFPYHKNLTEFKFEQIPSLSKPKVMSLSPDEYIPKAGNLCFLGQTGTGKTHLSIALGLEACKKGYSVLFFTAAHLVNLLLEARSEQRLIKLQQRMSKIQLLIVDELGYIPFSKDASELLFQLFADRYEKKSMIITSNLEISKWTQFLGDPTMTSALLDRLTHHAEIFTLNGESFRFKQRKEENKEK